MPTIPQSVHGTEDGPIPPVDLHFLIGRSLLKSLGSPSDMLKVKVHPVGNDRYRVNVLVGADVLCAKVAHSYFLVVDSDGKVVASSPRIKKHY